MKRWGMTLLLLAVFAMVAVAVRAGDEPAWLDPEHCSMCKHLTAERGLMEHMSWENHLISTGVMMVTTVEPEYAEAFKKAGAKMEKTAAELQAGVEMPLCGSCVTMGGLVMAGAKMDNVTIKAGHVTLLTATDADLISKIKAFGQRNMEEMKKYEAAHKKS